jgi:CBS domain-containing protein
LKTSSIAYRVADFLRRYPPFQYLSDGELLQLVNGGRVIFHEDGELVFEQGRRRSRYVYVIQQGVVRLFDAQADNEVLRDVRGDGDLLGVGRYLGIEEHLHSARTETDVILYALPADLFWTLVKRHPRASRFLAAYFSAAIMPAGLEVKQGRGDELRLGRRPVDWMARAVAPPPAALSCASDMPLREVAARLAVREAAAAAVVVDDRGAATGLITPRMLSDRVASGSLSPDAPARELMQPVRTVAAPGLEAGAYLTRMLQFQAEHLVLTADGRVDGRVQGVLSRRDLTRTEGAAPLAIVEDMACSRSITELAGLRAQGEAFIAAGLTDSESVRWLGPIAGAFDAAVLRRLVGLVEGALAQEGVESPELDHCWVFFGSAGRNELLTLYDLDHGLVYDEPEPDQRRAARSYFLELGRRVSAGLAACGFVTTAKAIVAGHPSACRSMGEWEHAFSRWISDPIESCVYRATSFFDLRPVHGDCRLVEQLQRHIHGEEDRNPSFVPQLVKDSMANLPPLTFFRGLVVDDDGGYKEVLDLQRATLQPVVDIARALALDCGAHEGPSTLDRLRALAPESAVADRLIEETAAAFRTALYHRARTGLTTGTDGSRVDPSKLTRLEQNLLKTGFRTVLQLMEYIGRRYGLTPRR